MPAEAITIDELMAALKDAGFTGSESDEGKSATELCVLWGMSRPTVLKKLAQAKEAGMLRVSMKSIVTLSGRPFKVPVYSFIFKPKPKRRGK